MSTVYFIFQSLCCPPPPPRWCIGVPHIGVTVVCLSGTALPMVVAGEGRGGGEGREPQSWGRGRKKDQSMNYFTWRKSQSRIQKKSKVKGQSHETKSSKFRAPHHGGDEERSSSPVGWRPVLIGQGKPSNKVYWIIQVIQVFLTSIWNCRFWSGYFASGFLRTCVPI